MAIQKKVNVVTIGAGWTAAILAWKLGEAGYDVVSLEQGPSRWTDPDFLHNHDPLRYHARHAMMVISSKRRGPGAQTRVRRPFPCASTAVSIPDRGWAARRSIGQRNCGVSCHSIFGTAPITSNVMASKNCPQGIAFRTGP